MGVVIVINVLTALIKEGRSSKSIDVAVDKAKKGLIKISGRASLVPILVSEWDCDL